MPKTPVRYPFTAGAKLSPEDKQKLDHLCHETQRSPGELLRLMIRMAEPTGAPWMTFTAAKRRPTEDADGTELECDVVHERRDTQQGRAAAKMRLK